MKNRGRTKGTKNLKRTKRGSIILPSGEKITRKELKAFRSAVVSSNRKRKRLIEQLPKEAKENYQIFGVESDWILRKKSTSITRFQNKKQFNLYLRQLRKTTKRDYVSKLVEIYRNNFIRAIYNTFNASADVNELINFINGLSTKDLEKLSLSEELSNIGYVYYDPKKVSDKLETLKKEMEKIKAQSKSA